MVSRRYRIAAWGLLGYSVAVIVWGALVRATLSGDGCGDHWPLCNGNVVPVAPSTETMIELTHRVTSGLCWVWAALMFFWSRRLEKKHPARRGAALGLFFMTTEALVGAGLVIFRMVAENPSAARGWWASAHLANTFLLLGALALHGHWASGGRAAKLKGRVGAAFLLLAIGMIAVGATGAIAALGDTLFPANSLSEGLAQDLSPTSHLFLRLRTLHPVLAIALAAGLLALGSHLLARYRDARLRRGALVMMSLICAQVGLGFLDVLLLAPLWLQLAHLVVADAVWISLVLNGARFVAVGYSTVTAPGPSDDSNAAASSLTSP